MSNEAYGCAAMVLSSLQTVLIIQKLIQFSDWSWWWVLAPTWMVCAFLAVVGISNLGWFKRLGK